MKIKLLLLGDMPTNGYIVYNDDNECIIADPGFEAEKVYKFVEENGLKPLAIVLTHAHFDHISAVNEVKNRYNIGCYCHEYEKELMRDAVLNLSGLNGRDKVEISPDYTFVDDEVVQIGGISFKVMHTPGHTKGGVCLYFEKDKILITGDTLFRGTVGRTDLPTGNYNEIIRSLNDKLMKLDDDVAVYPGHGYKTTVGIERRNNPYVD